MDNALKTVTEMIIQREYKITEDDEDKLVGTNYSGAQILIFKQLVIKFNVERVKEYINLLHQMKMKHCIVIYTESVTSLAKKLIENSVDIKIELFTSEELQYNLTKHRLNPIFERLSSEDMKEFKDTHGLRHPAILITDPVARFYDYQRGDVIRVIRKNDRDRNFTTFRIVKV